MHIATDRNGIIKEIIATTAKNHDSPQFEKLTKDETKAVFADSGYMSKKRKIELRAKNIFAGIVERRVRNQSKLRPKQSRNNSKFSKIRCLVELPFAFIKQHMNFRISRYRGIEKNQQHYYLIAASYNLRRTPALVRNQS
jgi:IS5 family transposase